MGVTVGRIPPMPCCLGAILRRRKASYDQSINPDSESASDRPGKPYGKLNSLTARERKSWLSIDSAGELNLHDIDYLAAASEYRISERDVSLVDPQEGKKVCPVRLAARGQASLVCLEGLRVVVSKSRALILSVPTAGSLLESEAAFSDSPFIRDLVSRLRISATPEGPGEYVDKSLPFELVVLEWALSTAARLLTEEVVRFEREAQPVLDELVARVSHRSISKLRHVKFGMADLSARVERFRLELANALEDVEGVQSGPSALRGIGRGRPGRNRRQHRRRSRQKPLIIDPGAAAECISLLECYLIQVEAAQNSVRNVQTSSGSTEASVRLSMKLRRLRLGRW